jgi:hypothetical protein
VADTGAVFPGSGTSVSSGDANEVTWTTPENITAADSLVAAITAATFDSPDPSFYLLASNFGFSIPVGSTIDGIQVDINRRSIIANSGVDNELRLQDDTATLVGDDKASATVWPNTLTTATYGGAADTWNASPTVAMVNDPDFGVALQARANIANADISVEWVTMTITYTPPAATAYPLFLGPDPSIYPGPSDS